MSSVTVVIVLLAIAISSADILQPTGIYPHRVDPNALRVEHVGPLCPRHRSYKPNKQPHTNTTSSAAHSTDKTDAQTDRVTAHHELVPTVSRNPRPTMLL